MNELEALLSDLEQLYHGNVREMESRSRGVSVGHQAPPLKSPQMHYATAAPGATASQAPKLELPPRPQNNPYLPQVAPHQVAPQQDRQKELLIRQQQELIQEQSRQIEQLKRLQHTQQQEVPRPMSPGRSTTGVIHALDDIMDDLSQLIAADTKALPDTILDDLQNLELRPATTALQQHRRPTSPPLPVVAPMGVVPTRARPVSSHYPRASAITHAPAVQAIGAPPGGPSPGMAHTGTRRICDSADLCELGVVRAMSDRVSCRVVYSRCQIQHHLAW
jgi:hypothetical protein